MRHPDLHPFTDEQLAILRRDFPLFSQVIRETSQHEVEYGLAPVDPNIEIAIRRFGKPGMGVDWEAKFVGISAQFTHLKSEMDIFLAVSALHELGHIIRQRAGVAFLSADIYERIIGFTPERMKELFLEEAEAWEIAEELLDKSHLPIPLAVFKSQRRRLLESYLPIYAYDHPEESFFMSLVHDL